MAWALLLSCSSTRSIIRTPPPLSLPPPNPSNRLRRSLDPRVSESAEVELRCVVGRRRGGGGGGGGLSRGRVACRAKRGADAEAESSSSSSSAAAAALWAAEAAYVVWLFLLPYAPVAEGLFNFVIGWTFLFAPLLFTDRRRDRYKGSLDLLWGCQMFLTNVFLIPYMAIRLNDAGSNRSPVKPSQLGSVMVRGAPVVGLIGGLVCIVSTLWALFGRADGGFGGLTDRWLYLGSYIGSERLAYAFVWDILLYAVFQPWLIGDNLQNVKKDYTELVNVLRFVPVVGLVAYLLCLDSVEEP